MDPGFQVCDLLDLLGETDAPLQESTVNINTVPTSTSSSASGNLLDLLGGLQSTPGTFVLSSPPHQHVILLKPMLINFKFFFT